MKPLLGLLLLLLGAQCSDHGMAAAAAYTPEAEADRVTAMPGAPGPLDFGLFSGHVTVDEDAGRALFYVFAEARADPHNAPLVLWLNGGPGCSSLGGGFMSELGPWWPTRDGRGLVANPWPWNDMANVLWLESPAFVGFSYSNTSSDAVVGDARTAADARLFLLHWLRRFPHLASADLYLSGESYGGHYVPNLALAIVRGNKRAGSDASSPLPGRGHLNLKGFIVGNAWTDAAIDNRNALQFWYTHALVGAESAAAVEDACDFATIGPLSRGAHALSLPGTHSAAQGAELAQRLDRQQQAGRAARGARGPAAPDLAAARAAAAGTAAARAAASGSPSGHSAASAASGLGHARLSGWTGYGSSATTRFSQARGGPVFEASDSRELVCAKWLDVLQAELGNINIYEIYADVCTAPPPSASNGATSPARRYRGALLGDVGPRARRSAAGGADDGRQPRRPRYDPCVDGEVEVYLNTPEVQAALHANQSVKLPWRWTDCTQQISYSRDDLLSSMLPVYAELLAASPALKMWVFSGDVDGIVPVLGSRRWIESLQLPVVTPWRSWTSTTGQVGGWRIDYQGLTFATIRNAGHMCPYVQPERTYYLLGEFLFGDGGAEARRARARSHAAAAPVAAS